MKRFLFAALAALLLVCGMPGSLAEDCETGPVDARVIELEEIDLEALTLDLPSGTSDAQALDTERLVLGVREKHTLKVAGVAAGDCAFVSADKKVATVSAKGVITARKAGKTVVTVACGELRTACAVTVKKAPSKVTLSAKTLTLGVGEIAALKATLPSRTAGHVAFTSGKPGVAAVNGKGEIIALKPGTATITARTYNGKSAKCKVTVKAAPTSFALNPPVLKLSEGDTASLKPHFASGETGAVRYRSGNEAVVKVDDKGTVLATGRGSAVITARTYNGVEATCQVDVLEASVYRALLIAEVSYPGNDIRPGFEHSAVRLSLCMGQIRGANGGKWKTVLKTDRTRSQIFSDIKNTFAYAKDNDVSLFFINCHGDVKSSSLTNRYTGCLYDQNMTPIALRELAEALAAVPGRVVVVIDSCGSGAAIYDAHVAQNSAGEDGEITGTPQADAEYDAAQFDQLAIDAFADLDSGVEVEEVLDFSRDLPSVGEFRRENKFYVLTASRFRERSWSNLDCSYFTKWFCDAIGDTGKLPADSNKDGKATLNELFKYISNKGDHHKFKPAGGGTYYQHVQVYPRKSGFVVFAK